MTTYLGKSCSFCLPRVPFVNCRQFMYLVISLLVLRAGYEIWLYQFLIIAYLFTLDKIHRQNLPNTCLKKDAKNNALKKKKKKEKIYILIISFPAFCGEEIDSRPIKICKMICAPSEDSDQPAHLYIKVLIGRFSDSIAKYPNLLPAE